MPVEEWRPAVGFPDYEVSDHGRVRGLPRISIASNGVSRRLPGRLLTPSTPDNEHYATVGLRRDGQSVTQAVHRMVLLAFVGPPLPGQQGAHWDKNKENNRLENLRWAFPKENNDDKLRHGSKLSSKPVDHELVAVIKRRARLGKLSNRYKDSGNIAALAKEYGLSRSAVFRIAKGEWYKWLG